jgi:hypothetical protein
VFPVGVLAVEPLGSIGSVTPRFAWTVGTTPGFATPVTYRLRIAADSLVTAALVDTVLEAGTFDPPRALAPGTLWWRVDAVAATGDFGTSGAVGPVIVPPWADLLTLDAPGGTTTLDSQPLLRWSSPTIGVPPGPFRYDALVHPVAPVGPSLAVYGVTDTSVLTPSPLERGVTYRWSVVAHAGSDSSATTSLGTFIVLDPSVPQATLLYQNFPNPFGATPTCLWFDLATASSVELQVLDLRGRLVRVVVPGAGVSGSLPAGRYGRGEAGGPTCDPRLTWDGTTADGRVVPAGVYLVRLKAGGTVYFVRAVYSPGGP